MVLWPAVILGFLGGFHCIGMCGPIALALPVHNKGMMFRIVSILSYNLGRIFTYGTFGLIFGSVGQSFALFGFQQALSVTMGVIILLILIFTYTGKSTNYLLSKLSSVAGGIKTKLTGLFKRNTVQSFLLIGILNGLLPCGLVYVAIAGAISTGNIVSGALFMMLFGVGTLPFMFAVSYYSHLVSVTIRNRIRKVVPVFVGIMAVLLILRGLNLGIAYVSPKLDKECSSNAHSETCGDVKTLKCCHK